MKVMTCLCHKPELDGLAWCVKARILYWHVCCLREQRNEWEEGMTPQHTTETGLVFFRVPRKKCPPYPLRFNSSYALPK
jgi:hypothetical protein